MARWKEVLEPLVAIHQGRVFKRTGDGVFVEFGSAVNAIECAAALQQALADLAGEIQQWGNPFRRKNETQRMARTMNVRCAWPSYGLDITFSDLMKSISPDA